MVLQSYSGVRQPIEGRGIGSFYLGGTDPDDPQLQDEEILFLVQKFAGE